MLLWKDEFLAIISTILCKTIISLYYDKQKRVQIFPWTHGRQEAFHKVQVQLTKPPALHIPMTHDITFSNK